MCSTDLFTKTVSVLFKFDFNDFCFRFVCTFALLRISVVSPRSQFHFVNWQVQVSNNLFQLY